MYSQFSRSIHSLLVSSLLLLLAHFYMGKVLNIPLPQSFWGLTYLITLKWSHCSNWLVSSVSWKIAQSDLSSSLEVVWLTAIDGGSTPREIMAKAFLVSKRTGRIWAEYLRRIQFFRPLSWGTTYPRSSSFHFSGVAPPLVPHQMCSLLDATKQSQKRSGHPF